MNSAKKHTVQRDMTMRKETMPLRIVGEHIAENLPDNSLQQIHHYESGRTNGGIIIYTSNITGKLVLLTDTQTKAFSLYQSSIGLWDIYSKPTAPKFKRLINVDDSKFHFHEKRYDYWGMSNQSWVEMDKPPMLRGIDLQHPELW